MSHQDPHYRQSKRLDIKTHEAVTLNSFSFFEFALLPQRGEAWYNTRHENI